MFVVDHTEGIGWHDARIVPYQPIALDPAAMVFHYGQPDGSVRLFRPEKNAQRMLNTNARMCMPALPVEDFVQAVKAIVRTDAD